MSNSNRLSSETSPYLLQHAHNPVDWYPWGDEALQRARREDRPIFLSVGYSTCYWCHVMERECFENDAIAAQMNRAFVNVKVDREERPDVDQLYMTAVQVITRQGGWPMSVFLTPDLRPFYAGTYFPPADSHGRPGFPKILAAVADAFARRRDEVNASAEQITGILRQISRPRRPAAGAKIDQAWVKDLIDRSAADFDEEHGGFGTAPKFPRQTLLELLLVYLRDNPDPELMRMLTRSLDAMAYGGIRDHLGGGFHRYSTDARWLVPHFEIMLYDNAMLLWIYAEAHRQTGHSRYAAIARGIADFVLREMTADAGAFLTAFDAEVDDKEGDNYLWTRQQVSDALAGKSDAERFCRVYGLDDGPNFTDPHHGDGMPDRNVLFLADPDNGSALTDPDLDQARQILYGIRRARKQPILDRKILTSWNALMIRGLAHAGTVLKEQRYLKAAQACADFLLGAHRDAQGGLLRVSAGAAAKQPAFLDDYAFLIQALLALPGAEYRAKAIELAKIMLDRFSAGAEGGFFYTDEQATDLIVRQMVGSDSPLPSGNGVAAMALLELGDWKAAQATISAFAGQMEGAGEGMSALVQAAMLHLRDRGEITVAGESQPDLPRSPAELAAYVTDTDAEWDGPLLRVTCRVAPGYHLNAHDAAVEPTRLTVTGGAVEAIEYPPGELRNQFEISVRFKLAPSGTLKLKLSYQACDASACLPPITRTIEIAPAN
ncbi:MAG: DUF255 domain-containing protein [Tepidisphaeraceae bacterium]